jgi:hypothetical protein
LNPGYLPISDVGYLYKISPDRGLGWPPLNQVGKPIFSWFQDIPPYGLERLALHRCGLGGKLSPLTESRGHHDDHKEAAADEDSEDPILFWIDVAHHLYGIYVKLHL